MLRKTLILETDLFNASTASPDFINPRCFGEDFARWLSQRLIATGLEAPDILQEDFGWVVLQPFRGLVFTIAIGVADDSIGAVPASWYLSVGFEKSLNGLHTWFRPAPAAELYALLHLVSGLLQRDPRIQNIQSE